MEENTTTIRLIRSCSSSLLMLVGFLALQGPVDYRIAGAGFVLVGVVQKAYNLALFFKANPLS